MSKVQKAATAQDSAQDTAQVAPSIKDSTGKSFELKGNKVIVPSKLKKGEFYEPTTADLAQHMLIELAKTSTLADGSTFVDPSTVIVQFFTVEEFEMHGNHLQRNGHSIIEKLFIP